MENIKTEKEEVKKTEGNEQLKRGLIIVGAVAAGCTLYGIKVGFRLGYERGAKDGIVYATNQFVKAVDEYSKERKEAKGSK